MKTLLIIILLLTGTIFFMIKKWPDKIVMAKKTIITILEKRHSGYKFNPTKEVSPEYIKSLIRAAQLTPSSYNEQPWNFIIGDKFKNPKAYNKLLSCLVEFNQQWAQNAPLLIAITAFTHSQKNNEPNFWASFDTGAAAFSMTIQATALDLLTHQIGGFNKEKAIELLHLPPTVIPLSILAIGYENPNAKETKPKKRKPISENFFEGDWGIINNNWTSSNNIYDVRSIH